MAKAIWDMFSLKWVSPPKPLEGTSFEGKTIMVTGATAGIGLEAVHKFAALGATRVIMAARDPQKGASTKALIENRLGRKDQLEVWELDMNSFDSVVAFAKKAETLKSLDIAVLNAGCWRVKYAQSPHGWEEDLQVNTLSTILLAILLLPKLQATKKLTGRTSVLEIVNSILHRDTFVRPEAQEASNIIEFYNRRENFNTQAQYNFTKLAQMYATRVLSTKVSSEDVIITSICPGAIKTDISRDVNFPGAEILKAIAGFLLQNSPEIGANTILTGTVQGEKAHGRFWRHDAIQPIAPSLAREDCKKFGDQMWQEIVEILGKEVAGADVMAVLKGL